MEDIGQNGKYMFWEYANTGYSSPCWLWRGYVARDGYGRVYIAGKYEQIHRVMYNIHIGDIPYGLILDHVCKRRDCCNPYHLEPITDKENKRRGKNTSLTFESVSKIKELILTGMPQKDIALIFNVKVACISKIKTGRRWN